MASSNLHLPRWRAWLIAGALAAALTARAAFTPADALAAAGPVIRADHGKGPVVTLRGTNLGGCFLLEPWMCPTGPGLADDYSIRQKLRTRFGAPRADALLREYQAAWITEKDLDALHEWGFNVVRVPVNWLDFMTEAGEWKPHGWDRLDWLLQQCDRRRIYVIIDLHGVPGGASPWASSGHEGDDGTGQNPNGFWTDPRCLALTEKLWAEIAARYRGRAVVAGVDLVNEPVYRFGESGDGKTLTAAVRRKSEMIDRLYRAVRQADPGRMVIVEAFTIPGKGDPAPHSAFEGITAPAVHGWTNVVYETHYYDMDHADNRAAQERLVEAALADITAHQRAWNVPMYAGEYCLYGFDDVWRRWMTGLNAAHVSWTNWTYKVRAGATEPGGGNWGFFNTYRGPMPDLAKDSAADIAHAWSQVTSDHFGRNDHLIELVRPFTH